MNTDLKKLNNPCNKCGALLNPDNEIENVVNHVFIKQLRNNQ